MTLPLFADDLVQIPWLESITWRELWTTPSPYGYYRPMWYSLWRLWGALTGGLRPAGLHALNLIAHFGASWLAGLLAAAWIKPEANKSRLGAACIAAAIFAVFPFARQAVAWPGAVYNPLVSAMATGALLAYDRGRQDQRATWIMLALSLAGIAAFHYEAGLLVAPLIILVECIGRIKRRWERRGFWWVLAFAALFVVTTLIWRTMRGPAPIGFGLTPVNLRRNIGFLAQGLIYPLAPLAQAGVTRLGLAPEICLWAVALPVMALLAWHGLRSQCGMFLLGTGWFALFALPPLISMDADWFALAPRFLYMTATGTALIWTAAMSGILARQRSLWRAAVVISLILLLIPAALFVRHGVQLYTLAGESIWDAAEAAQHTHPILLVNLPMEITPRSRLYPLGFEGVTPLPARVTAEELVYVHTGIPQAAEAAALGIVAPEAPAGYTYQIFGQPVNWEELASAARRAQVVYLTRYDPERIYLVEAGGILANAHNEPLARFAGRVALLDAVADCDADGQVHLTAIWRAEEAIETDATVFAHLLSAGSNTPIIAQADGYPLLGMLPFWLWLPGETVRDMRTFPPVTSGSYTIRLGLWEPATGERWPAEGEPDGVVLLPIRCP